MRVFLKLLFILPNVWIMQMQSLTSFIDSLRFLNSGTILPAFLVRKPLNINSTCRISRSEIVIPIEIQNSFTWKGKLLAVSSKTETVTCVFVTKERNPSFSEEEMLQLYKRLKFV